ncbi:MAG TPA: HAD-IIB family hydrolase [Candidatus Paceibacterota bacterium]|nr:HAD-IIB family hydrolase [Candidatus Paceibacterota bacterium]
MTLPKAIVFDLDGTLAVSKSPLAEDMAAILERLLERMQVAVTSGASLEQFMGQFVSHLTPASRLSNLYLLPTSGAALYTFENGTWSKVYAETMTDAQMDEAERAIAESLDKTGMVLPPSYGPRVERRQRTQVAFSAVGQRAPVEVKRVWDPDQEKRRKLVDIIKPLLPWAEVRIGGMTTIDITRKGIDKRYGVEHLARRLNLQITDMLYVGDALFPGGNDEVVIGSGIQVHAVKDPAETAEFLTALLLVAE